MEDQCDFADGLLRDEVVESVFIRPPFPMATTGLAIRTTNRPHDPLWWFSDQDVSGLADIEHVRVTRLNSALPLQCWWHRGTTRQTQQRQDGR